jgi:hypothetical protein
VAAAISIGGVRDVFGTRFFDHADTPFLMIAGTADAIVDYELNALSSSSACCRPSCPR